jgi:polyhydroxybutyrate depolymerase
VHPELRAAAAAFAALATAGVSGCAVSNASADYRSAAHPQASTKPSATPAPPPAIPAGMRRMSVAGRSYLLSVPKNLERPAPLVVALGGIGWTVPKAVAMFRLGQVAAGRRAVVAYPDPVKGIWNAGGCCWGATTNDVGFLTQMRAQIARHVPLDSRRQVLMGYSNGGMLAYEAACADTHWNAIVVLGASLTTRCTPSHPFSITNVNGEGDVLARWNGGYADYTKTVMPAVWQIDQQFAAAFGCGPAAETHSSSNNVLTYTACSGGVYVRDIRVPGLRHHWPAKELDGYDMGPVLWRLVLG